jgi:hypothetical protein
MVRLKFSVHLTITKSFLCLELGQSLVTRKRATSWSCRLLAAVAAAVRIRAALVAAVAAAAGLSINTTTSAF